MKKKDILERLDAYRAIEINNLWQRSVFLGTFLVLGYTSYGFLLDKMLSEEKIERLQLLHFLVCGLSCINIIFSVLWIAMAKGSKAWYESYENAINFVENSNKNKFSLKEILCEIDLRRKKNSNKYKSKNRNNKKKFEENLKNDSFFSTRAGGFSPSKINIALGQISFVLWGMIMLIHIVLLFVKINIEQVYFVEVIMIIIVFITYLVVYHLYNSEFWIKSSYFLDSPKKKSKNTLLFPFMIFLSAILICCICGIIDNQKTKSHQLGNLMDKLSVKELQIEKINVDTINVKGIKSNEIEAKVSTIQNLNVSSSNVSSAIITKAKIDNMSVKKSTKEYKNRATNTRPNVSLLNNEIPQVKEFNFIKTIINQSKCDSLISFKEPALKIITEK